MSPTQPALRARPAPWLLLMFHLPAAAASQRVSVWRKLQKYGALAWKHSAYLLPNTPGNLEKFQWLLAEIRKYRGEGSIARVAGIEGLTNKEIVALFNNARARECERLSRDLRLAMRKAQGHGGRRGFGLLGRFKRRLAEIAARDVFGCAKRHEAEALMKALESHVNPNQSGPSLKGKKFLKRYQGRIWMTRPRPEIDRVASAWLIRNWIDSSAKFAFSPDPQAHPEAVCFDMFEGEFTHVGEDCTFETLMKRFAVRDEHLRLIAQVVHDADLDDDKFGRSEGKALQLILQGWARMDWSDEEILRKGFELFDALYLTLRR